MSGLEDMENMMNVNAAGDTPAVVAEPVASVATASPVEVVGAPATGPRQTMGGGASARDVALQGLSPSLREQVIADAAEMGIRIENDLSWLLVGAQVRAWAAAQASGRYATECVAAGETLAALIDKLPAVVQKAAAGASGDIAGQINAVLAKKIPDFGSAIKVGVMAGVEDAVASVNSAAGKLADAAGKFDSDVDKTVIARRDAVLAQWVQSGSDALEKRMAAAVHKERIFNVYLILFMSLSMLVIGIVLGMHLHF
jgi:hypothetical protein